MTTFGIVYRAFDTSNGKSYVGQTTQEFSERIKQHHSKSSNSRKLRNALMKRSQSFVWSVLSSCFNEREMNNAEIYWSEFFDCIEDGYNLRECGDGHGKMSHESRALMSMSRIGNQNGKGYHPTPEQISRQKETRKRNLNGKDFFSPLARRMSHLAQRGSKHSEETKRKMSSSQKARREREKMGMGIQ